MAGDGSGRTKADRLAVALLAVLSVVAIGVVLKYAQSVILPLVVAWFLSYLAGPVVQFMVRRKIPTSLAVLGVLVLMLGACFLAGVFLHGRISAIAGQYGQYEQRFSEIVSDVAKALDLKSNPLADADWGKRIGGFLMNLAQSFVSFLSFLVTVIVFLIFLLLGRPYFRHKIERAFSPDQAERIGRIAETISTQMSMYLFLQVLMSLLTGFLVWLVLAILRVDFAITWGVLAFFLNFIPIIGSVAATIPPVLLSLVRFYPNYWPAVICLGCLGVVQMGIANAVVPKVMGSRLNLSPVVILLTLLFWGWIWGIAGALLSIPIASAIKIVCDNIEPLHPIGVMMASGAGRPSRPAAGEQGSEGAPRKRGS